MKSLSKFSDDAFVPDPLLPSAHGGPDAQGVARFDFSTNGNAVGSYPTALQAVQTADATRYPDPGYGALREKLAELHAVTADRVVMAASASEFIFRMTGAAKRLGVDDVDLPPHGYGDYARAALAWGMKRTSEAAKEPAGLVWRCDPSSPLGQAVAGLGVLIDELAPTSANARPRIMGSTPYLPSRNRMARCFSALGMAKR